MIALWLKSGQSFSGSPLLSALWRGQEWTGILGMKWISSAEIQDNFAGNTVESMKVLENSRQRWMTGSRDTLDGKKQNVERSNCDILTINSVFGNLLMKVKLSYCSLTEEWLYSLEYFLLSAFSLNLNQLGEEGNSSSSSGIVNQTISV